MFHWAKVRHDDGAERTLLAALDSGLTREALNRLIFGSLQERVYADGGHALDLSNKAFELLDLVGWEQSAEIFPLIVEYLTQSQSEEERGAWRAPRDLIELIREAEQDLSNRPLAMRPEAFCRPDFYRELLEEDPRAILSSITAAITDGVPPVEITRHLTLAAAWRLARFPESNDIDDWSGPMHTFSLGHPEPDLVDTLTFATVREDLDFHKLQVIEAGVTQAQVWRPGGIERELLYTAVARYLAAHCPTRRSSSQSVAVALRLHEGEEIYFG
jgi:hypothetical protein